jgi:hypothetical protein
MNHPVYANMYLPSDDNRWAAIVDKTCIKLFPQHRPARSPQYKLGVRWALANRLMVNSPPAPMQEDSRYSGTAELDAYCAGIEEGANSASDFYPERCRQVRETRRKNRVPTADLGFAQGLGNIHTKEYNV